MTPLTTPLTPSSVKPLVKPPRKPRMTARTNVRMNMRQGMRKGMREGKPMGRRGFSLIEILTVLAIVAVLAALTLPGFRDQVMKGRRAEAREALQEIQLAQPAIRRPPRRHRAARDDEGRAVSAAPHPGRRHALPGRGRRARQPVRRPSMPRADAAAGTRRGLHHRIRRARGRAGRRLLATVTEQA
jgi:prepilin-type N-terminal cleavage/methylation domain-containing protein